VKSLNQLGSDIHTTPLNSRSMRFGPPSSRSPGTQQQHAVVLVEEHQPEFAVETRRQ
jgi:hypothetical protein